MNNSYNRWIRELAMVLSIELPIYSAILIAPLYKYRDLLLVSVTVFFKLLLVYLEFRNARKDKKRKG